MNAYLPHEKLVVYAEALSFAQTMLPLVDTWPASHAIRDQIQRASESILTNLAKAARRRRTNQGIYHFECSLGSVLECAACTDIALVKGLIDESRLQSGKETLQRIARMEVGLRKSWCESVHEEAPSYGNETGTRFPHESLKAYQSSLQPYRVLESVVLGGKNRRHRNAKKLDEAATSLVLNIAEGNGRFSKLDHGKFVGIAEDAGALLAVHLDMAAFSCSVDVMPAKALLREIVAMLAGLKGYLGDDGEGGN